MTDIKRKVTKKDYFLALRSLVETADMVGDYVAEDMLDFIDKQISSINAKAEKAKEKAAEKKAAGDNLRNEIQAILTHEYQTADDIVAALNQDDITKAKIIPRLTQLCNMNIIEKAQVQTEDKRRVMGYKLI